MSPAWPQMMSGNILSNLRHQTVVLTAWDLWLSPCTANRNRSHSFWAFASWCTPCTSGSTTLLKVAGFRHSCAILSAVLSSVSCVKENTTLPLGRLADICLLLCLRKLILRGLTAWLNFCYLFVVTMPLCSLGRSPSCCPFIL